MNSIILCEGFDDVFILGYYLFKTSGWKREKDGKISDLYDFPKVNFSNQIIEVYKKGNDSLAIWGIGGKDSFEKPFKFLKKINEIHPQEGFGKIFILSDRDSFQIEDCIKTIEVKMKKYGFDVYNLQNNKPNEFSYEVENEIFNLYIIPIIIPFNEEGSIENILLNAIKETGEDEKYIVDEAKKYVDSLIYSGKLKNIFIMKD